MFNESISINGPLTINITEDNVSKDITVGNVNANIRSNGFDLGIRFQDGQSDTIKNNSATIKQAIDGFISQVNAKINSSIGADIR